MVEQEKSGSEEQESSTLKKNLLVKERFEIKYDEPIKWLDNNGANAFRVIDKIDLKRELFALICSNQTSPRTSILPYLKSIDNSSLMKLVEYGTITDPKDNHNKMALIYQKPLGGRVADNLANIDFKSNPDLLKSIILSLISISEVLKGYNLTHRSIRLNNLYYKDEEKINIVIGDCAATFPAYEQPSIYEPVESAMSIPEGRGNGTDKNDIYSIAITCLSLLSKKELFSDLTAPEILRIKLKKGSYATLSGEEKIPLNLVPLFKGMLNDYNELRWNYIQVYNFLQGKVNNFPTPTPNENSQRSLTINGEKVHSAKNVSYYMLNNQEEALELIKNGKLLDWIKNGLENEKLYTKLEKIIKQELSETGSINYLVSRICIMIDPSLPIKVDDLCLFPDGAPKAMFIAFKNQNNMSSFNKLFSSDLIKLWYQEQESLRSPANASEFKIYTNRSDIGYGLVRIMYDFDEDLPCISPLFGDEFVNSIGKVLRALDNNFKKPTQDKLPYDNNIIAYLRCKMGKKIDGILIDLNSNKEEIQISAIIRLYSSIQNKYGPAQLGNLCQWLLNSSKPIIHSYHNIKFQKFLEREIVKSTKNGKIIELYELLENDEARQKDKTEYANALNDIKYLLNEKHKLVNGEFQLDEEAKEMAIKFGGILAVSTMVTSFVFNLINWMIK